jgi:two-component system, sensor histidine kinase
METVTFLTVVAHELRSPLAPIANALEVLTIHGESDEVTAEAHAIIRRQLDRLGRLIEDLLDMGRIVHGGIKLQKEPIDLAVVIADAVETVHPLIQLKSLDLRINLPPEQMIIEVDAVRIAQVLVNLLTNSVKYTAPGGMIAVSVHSCERWAALRVLDSGVGIDPEDLPTIFDLFVRGAPRCASEGLGIGLAISRQLIELHGGSISAHSEGQGRGSEFVVQLPRPAQGITCCQKTMYS